MIVFAFSTIPWDYPTQRPQQLLTKLGLLGHKVFHIGRFFKGVIDTVNVVDVRIPVTCTSSWNPDIPGVLVEVSLQHLCSLVDALDTVLIWSCAPWTVDFVELLRGRLEALGHLVIVVYDVLDAQREFKHGEERKKKMFEFCKRSMAAADIVFYTTKLFKEILPEGKSVLLPNACDPERWEPRFREFGIGTVGYFGSISHWMDFAILDLLNIEGEVVHLLGPLRKFAMEKIETRKLAFKRRRIRFGGEILHSELPRMIRGWRAGLIPFVKSRLTDHVNPIKFYEYSAAGLPIISTDLEEVRRLSKTMPKKIRPVLVSSLKDWPGAIRNVVKTDTEEKVYARVRWAKKHSWENRVQKMLRFIRKVQNVKEEKIACEGSEQERI